MRRLAVVLAAAAVAFVAFGAAQAEDAVLEPSSADAGQSVEFLVHPPHTPDWPDEVTMIVPAGFRVWGCQSFAYKCYGITDDPSQPTTMRWTREGGSGGDPDSRSFACQAVAPPDSGTYTFQITVKYGTDTQTFAPTVRVIGAAAAASTTTTTTSRPHRTTTTSSSTTTSTSTSTTEVPTTTTSTPAAVAAAQSDSGGSNAAPLAAGIVGLAAVATGGAFALRRMRGVRAGGLGE
jgi:uncharacterized protein YcnI